ncbi:MAG: hypothetical protein IJY12_01170 [Clostridia bacterium]|nr:hypothetical protein [Clostridia bacterium]
MKKNKFALLVLLILCVTITGAYATWSYVAADNVEELNEKITVNLANKEETTVDGGKLTSAGAITAVIDNGGNYVADLVLSGDGITVTYDATDSADPTATDITMVATISVTTNTYDSTSILTVTTQKLYSDGPVSSWTITPEMLDECLELMDVTLPTPTDYDNFAAALDGTEINITIGALS